MASRPATAIAVLIAVTGLLASRLAQAQNVEVLRYRCALLDGSTHLFSEDVSRRNPGLATCESVRMRADPLVFEGARGGAGWSERMAEFVMDLPAPAVGGGGAGAGFAAPMPDAIAKLVGTASERHGLDPALVSALIFVESRYQPRARSPKGALGLMQLMPATAADYGATSTTDLFDPRVNIDIGTRHLRTLRDLYPGRIDLALAAYNAGSQAVRRYGNRIPPYPETEDYVRQIVALAARSRADTPRFAR